MTFVVDNNALELNKKKTKLERLQRVEEFLKIDIEKNRKTLKSINSSQSDLENYGREQFFMKRSDEDVYMVIER